MGRFQVTDQSYDPVVRLLRSEFDDFIVLLPVCYDDGREARGSGDHVLLNPTT